MKTSLLNKTLNIKTLNIKTLNIFCLIAIQCVLLTCHLLADETSAGSKMEGARPPIFRQIPYRRGSPERDAQNAANEAALNAFNEAASNNTLNVTQSAAPAAPAAPPAPVATVVTNIPPSVTPPAKHYLWARRPPPPPPDPTLDPFDPLVSPRGPRFAMEYNMPHRRSNIVGLQVAQATASHKRKHAPTLLAGIRTNEAAYAAADHWKRMVSPRYCPFCAKTGLLQPLLCGYSGCGPGYVYDYESSSIYVCGHEWHKLRKHGGEEMMMPARKWKLPKPGQLDTNGQPVQATFKMLPPGPSLLRLPHKSQAPTNNTATITFTALFITNWPWAGGSSSNIWVSYFHVTNSLTNAPAFDATVQGRLTPFTATELQQRSILVAEAMLQCHGVTNSIYVFPVATPTPPTNLLDSFTQLFWPSDHGVCKKTPCVLGLCPLCWQDKRAVYLYFISDQMTDGITTRAVRCAADTHNLLEIIPPGIWKPQRALTKRINNNTWIYHFYGEDTPGFQWLSAKPELTSATPSATPELP